jgi:hypothetical protein
MTIKTRDLILPWFNNRKLCVGFGWESKPKVKYKYRVRCRLSIGPWHNFTKTYGNYKYYWWAKLIKARLKINAILDNDDTSWWISKDRIGRKKRK